MDELMRCLTQLDSMNEFWERGDNLALLPHDVAVSPGETLFEMFSRGAAGGVKRFSHLSRHDQVRWGAVMMVAGAMALKRAGAKPKSYATIGEAIAYPSLAGEFRGDRLEALEDGTKQYLGLNILRDARGRCFVETMLANSGLDMDALARCADLVVSSWTWNAVANAQLADVEQFISSRMDAPRRLGHKVQLEDPAFLCAICDRLIELARWRREILERGLVRASVDETRTALDVAGMSLRYFLGSEPSGSLLRALLTFERSGSSQRLTIPHLIWSTSEVAYGLGLSVPRRIACDSLPMGVERARLVAIDRSGRSFGPSEGVSYVRSGSIFRRVAGADVLPINSGLQLPIELVLCYLADSEELESPLSTAEFPQEPVSMFHTSTQEYIHSAAPGTPVILVCSPGWRLLDAPVDLHRVDSSALEAWRAVVPSRPIELTFEGPAGEGTTWSFGQAEPVRLHPRGEMLKGVRFKGAPVFTSWPDIWVYGLAGDAKVKSPDGLVHKVRVRRGRVASIPALRGAGLYCVQIEKGSQNATTRFVLLPPEVRFSIRHGEPDETGLSSSSVSVEGATADLRSDASDGSKTSMGAIWFPPGTTGIRSISVALLGMNLAWNAGLHPPCARMLATDEAVLQMPWDLSSCDASSVLEIFGVPGSEVRIQASGRVFKRRLGPEGRREIRMAQLPSRLFDRASDRIDVNWGGGIHREYALVNPQLVRPPDHPLDNGCVLIQSRRALKDPIAADLLPAWEPWSPVETQPVRQVQFDGKPYYAVSLPKSPGPYMIALTERNRPVTGMFLAQVPGDRKLDDPLSRLLWAKGAGVDKMVEALRAHPPELTERIGATIERYGWDFFRVAEALPSVAGRSLLRRLLASPGDAEDCALGRLLRRRGYDLIAVSYADVDEVAAEVVLDKDRLLDVLDALLERGAGLLVAAATRWFCKSHDPAFLERWGEIMGPFAHLTNGGHWRLASHEAELLSAPGDPSKPAIGLRSDISVRLSGLIQARMNREVLSADQGLREIFEKYGRMRDEQFDLVVKSNARIPEETVRHEAAIFACAREVHHWRQGKGTLAACKDAFELTRHVRTLIDYWLNYWASQPQPKGMT